MTERMRVPSPLSIYNTFWRVYWTYFKGHPVRPASKVPPDSVRIVEEFSQEQFGRLGNSLTKLEDYLLWVFSKFGQQPLSVLNTMITEYLKEAKDGNEIKPFNIEVSKFIRKKKLKSWDEYLSPQGGHYPLILQHYISEKNIPFEFLLYVGVLNRLTGLQKKMVKSILGKELYHQKESLKKIERNQLFIQEEMRKINESFKANQEDFIYARASETKVG